MKFTFVVEQRVIWSKTIVIEAESSEELRELLNEGTAPHHADMSDEEVAECVALDQANDEPGPVGWDYNDSTFEIRED